MFIVDSCSKSFFLQSQIIEVCVQSIIHSCGVLCEDVPMMQTFLKKFIENKKKIIVGSLVGWLCFQFV